MIRYGAQRTRPNQGLGASELRGPEPKCKSINHTPVSAGYTLRRASSIYYRDNVFSVRYETKQKNDEHGECNTKHHKQMAFRLIGLKLGLLKKKPFQRQRPWSSA